MAGNAARNFAFIKNNYYQDAFFLKALTLNGACEGICRPKNGKPYEPNGVSYSGATYKFTVLDARARRRATQVGQLPQTSYFSLLTPYSYFGLGRTNNYVENLFVGSTRFQNNHFGKFEGLIPNSQVMINPYQPTVKPGDEEQGSPNTWIKSLYLHPGDWIPGVTLSLLGALTALIVTIVILHTKEQVRPE